MTTKNTITDEQIAELVNELAATANNVVFDYSSQFPKREDYRPLENLARRAHNAVVECAEKHLNKIGVEYEAAYVNELSTEEPKSHD